MQYSPAGQWFLQTCVSQRLIDDVVRHAQFTNDKVRHMSNLKVDRPDSLSEVLKQNDKKRMTVEEIVARVRFHDCRW